MSGESLESLASVIYEKAKELSKVFKDNGFESSLDKIPASDLRVASLKTRNELIEAAKDLLQLVMGPTEYLYSLALSAADMANIDLLVRFDIPQNVPPDSSITISALSTAVNLPKSELIRAVRYSIANGIFREPTPGHIAHSTMSTALANETHLRDILCFATLWGNVLTKIPEFLELQANYGNLEIKKLKTVFNYVFITNEDIFEYMTHSGDLNTKYHKYMMGRVHTPMWSMDRLRTAWDWSRLGSNILVDVGGSSGHTAIGIAPLAPNAKFIIQDIDLNAMEMGRAQLNKVPDAGTRSRIMFQKHNFFEEQPVCAEFYILRHILHDWKDEECIAMLKALLPALEPSARVFVSEAILSDPPAQRLNTLASKMILIEDQFVMAAHGSHERTLIEFLQLFKEASSRFHFIGITSGEEDGAFQSLLEFEFQ